jgi:molybdopterin molybdotransferase
MTISLSEAVALVERACAPVTETEPAGLAEADGRVLAEAIVAPIDVPAADNSAVDGYAVRYAAAGERRLALVGISAAGRPFGRGLEPGEAVRIFTGAVPPGGVDAVAMQEEVERDGNFIAVPAGLPPQANIRRAGEDIKAGSTVFAAGRRLGPVEIGMLASLGVTRVIVRRKLRVAVFSTGDELIEAGQDRRSGAIYDANRPTLLALLARLDVAVTDLGILPDQEHAIVAALETAAAHHDAIISSAGVSVGDEDHMRSAVMKLGSLEFTSVAIKPGKPVSFGHIGGARFFGLPGNPAAMLIGFLLLARPGLLRVAGAEAGPLRRYPVAADFALRHKQGRTELLRCSLHAENDGRLLARRFARGGAALLSSIAESDGLVEIGETIGDVSPGMVLPFIPFSDLGL